MMQRIHWIDWAKALAVMTVVFCHLPQSQEFFYYRYLQSVIITIFFFLSGYLKKDRTTMRENWNKYIWGLIIPYFIYNAVVYPYWILKFYLQNGLMPDFSTAIKPIVGALLAESDTPFSCALDGALWYLPAILLMHLLIDNLSQTRHFHKIMVTLCVISVFVYAANKYYYFLPQLMPMGVMRRLPYYYLGYVLGRQKLLNSHFPFSRSLTLAVSSLVLSLLFFHWHLQVMHTNHILHIALFYPVNLLFLVAIIAVCQLMERKTPTIITYLSIGTLLIIGLHQMIIGVVNQIMAHISSLTIAEGYQWYEALSITLLITALLYPLIPLAQKHWPILIGRYIPHRV